MGPLLDAIGRTCRVLRVDQPGHGDSARHTGADQPSTADLLVSTVGTAIYIGYSMGARTCLHAALAHPGEVRAMVLIGGTPGIADPSEREARLRADDRLAARLEEIGVDAFLEEWLALPMFSGLPGWARFESERRRNTVEGLAGSLRHAGTGTMEPLWERLAGIRCPVLCLTGEHDQRYGEIAETMTERLGGPARHVVVPSAGHAAHLERPEPVIAAVVGFVAGLSSG
jgi:2-succinyl-6-hydroxy-2,4-cyclohexadiene-1-carboxylate synthase